MFINLSTRRLMNTTTNNTTTTTTTRTLRTMNNSGLQGLSSEDRHNHFRGLSQEDQNAKLLMLPVEERNRLRVQLYPNSNPPQWPTGSQGGQMGYPVMPQQGIPQQGELSMINPDKTFTKNNFLPTLLILTNPD